jgi:hypothetical protein
MPYPALPDRRMPYHRDGTRIGYGGKASDGPSARYAQGFSSYVSGADLAEFNDDDYSATTIDDAFEGDSGNFKRYMAMWAFFPERREVTAMYWGFADTTVPVGYGVASSSGLQGSDDTTNGVDGTWETASFPSGIGSGPASRDGWRATIKPVSFTGPKRTIRWCLDSDQPIKVNTRLRVLHIYGEKAAGQTPDDILFIDDNTDLEFQAPLDFGDRPLGTTVTRVFRLKNASTSKTANSINLQCNDSDFAISSDGTTWVATLNFSSLAPGAETSNLYVRCTTPGPGAQLGPRFAEMVVIVGSWT